jgi:hypothetical protein
VKGDAASDIDGDVAYKCAAGRATHWVAQVSVTMQYEIDVVTVDDSGKFDVAEQRVFHDRLATKGRRRGREVGNDDFGVGIETVQRTVESRSLTPGAHSQCLTHFARKGVRPFIGPKTSAGSAHARDSNALSVDVNDTRRSVEHDDPAGCKRTAEGRSPHRSAVVIPQHGDYWHLHLSKEFSRELCLQQGAMVRYVTSNDEQIGTTI